MTGDLIEETLTEKIVRLWNSGLSGPKIGEQLGISHGKVAGTLFRERGKGTALRDAKIRYDRPKKVSRPAQPPKEPPVIKEDPEEPDAVGEKVDLKAVPFMDRQPSLRAKGQVDIPFDELGHHKCKWPAWTIESKIGAACGLISSSPISPYCAYHMRCAYNPAPRRTR